MRIVPRAEHTISRRDIDQDALKVLYRLREANHIAYLVGGSVRDLLLGRRPKDFDIGTSAHPYQVKRAFRNCWIIGRRFRLAHVKFGTKVIEVADGGVHVYDGSYAHYQRAKAAAAATPVQPVAESVPRTSRAASTQSAEERRRNAANLRQAERDVSEVEERLRQVEAALSDPASFNGDIAALAAEHADLQAEVHRLTERWAALAEAAES